MTPFSIMLIFSAGSIAGWVIEFFFRTFISQKKIVNPGFLSGPYLPLYGFGTTFLYLVSIPPIHLYYRIIFFFLITTFIEYITGEFFLRVYKIRLWDYSKKKFNYRGLVCPEFSLYWTLLSLVFYYLIFPGLYALSSSSLSTPFSYWTLGLFYGLILEDMVISFNLAARIRAIVLDIANAERRRLRVKMPDVPLNLRTIDFKVLKRLIHTRVKQRGYNNFLLRFLNPFMNNINTDLKDTISRYFDKIRNKSDL